jgi:hypothetical protein
MVNLRAAALDPNFSDPPVYGPQRPPEQERPQSILDILRQRVMREMEGEDLRRLGEYGAGMLASGSPNFFTMLGAGARAQAQGDASRMDRLRQVAETERQQRALENQEATQRAQEAYQQRRLDLEGPYREAQTDQARAYAEYLRQGGRGGGAAGRDPTPAALRTATVAANQALQAAIRQAGNAIPARTLSPQEQDTIWQAAYNRSIQGQGVQAPAGMPTPDVTAPAAPAAVIDVRANPTR